MKLPAENENPETGSPNPDSGSESREPQSADRSGANGAEVNGSEAAAGEASQDPDFSEFLWMENENDFDEQVLKELEDEEMMNYYYELYEASQEADNPPPPPTRGRGRGRGGGGGGGGGSWRDPGHQHNPQHYVQQVPAGCAGGYENPRVDPYASNQPRSDVDDLTQGVNSINFNAPRFNPDAAEFVPRAPTSVSAGGRDDSDRPPPNNQ